MSEIEKSRLKSIEAKDRFGLKGLAGKKAFTKEDLPTRKQLQLLLEEKGRNALAMYAWRNSLRALSFLTARLSIQEIWKKDTVKHVASVVRANVLLTLILLEKQLDNVGFRAYADDVTDAAATADDDAARAAADATASYAAARAAVYTARAAVYAARAAAYAVRAAAYVARAAPLVSNTINDFNFLVETDSPTTLFKEALWRDQTTDGEITQLQTQFLDELEGLGFGFLAEDIQKLWKGEQIDEVRLLRYADTEIGEDIWGNAKALEAYITGGAKADNNAVRVMLVGPGGAGKTSLRDLILQRKTELFKTATKGVEHHNHQAVDIVQHKEALSEISDDEVRKKAEKLDLFLWDFGGQSIFHNLHRGFIRRENCVYVLVVDSRHEQAPDEWLAQIRMIIETNFSSSKGPSPGEPEVPILIVTNSYEGIQRKQNQTRLLREFDGFLSEANFFEFPCISKKADESNDLSDDPEVSDAVLDAKFEDFMARLLTLASNTKAISELSGKATEALNELLKESPFVTKKAFKKKLSERGIDVKESWADIESSLKNLGRLVSIEGKYCLEPGWVVDVSYSLINHPQIQSSNGKVDQDTLIDLTDALIDEFLSDESSRWSNIEIDAELVIKFLVEQHATIKVSEGNNPHYFFPDAAASNEPFGLTNLLDKHKQQAEKRSVSLGGKALEDKAPNIQSKEVSKITGKPLTIEYHFPSLPLGFRTKFVVDVHNNKALKLSLPENVWRDGLRASCGNLDIWVDYQLAKQHITIRFFNYVNEAELAKPIGVIHRIIAELEGSATPILTQGFEHLTAERISPIFQKVGMFKLLERKEQERSKITNQHNYYGPAYRSEREQNVTDNSNSFNNNSNSAINAGDNNTQNITNSFNSESQQKQFILDAIAEVKAKEEFAEHAPFLQSIESAVTYDAEQVANDESGKATKLLKKLWAMAKDMKDAAEISAMLTGALSFF